VAAGSPRNAHGQSPPGAPPPETKSPPTRTAATVTSVRRHRQSGTSRRGDNGAVRQEPRTPQRGGAHGPAHRSHRSRPQRDRPGGAARAALRRAGERRVPRRSRLLSREPRGAVCRQHGAGAAAAAVRGRAAGSGAGQGRVPAVPRRLDVPEAAGPRAAELQPLHPPAGGGVAAAEPDGADLHRGGRRGHGGDVVRGRAAVPPVLPGSPGSSPSAPALLRAALSAAFPPLCPQATGLGGTTGAGRGAERLEEMRPVRERVLKVTFNADVHAGLQWNFRPQQSEIYVSWSGFAPRGAVPARARRTRSCCSRGVCWALPPFRARGSAPRGSPAGGTRRDGAGVL